VILKRKLGMKAAAIHRNGSADELEYVDVEAPEVEPHDIRVKTAYAAVNPVDIWTRRGVPDSISPSPPCSAGMSQEPSTPSDQRSPDSRWATG
jgi:NADPH:quinone reductase-like Zn-dependent oxidoreductase